MPKDKKTSKKAIIIGVVVGLVVIAGIFVGAFLYYSSMNHRYVSGRYSPNEIRGNFTLNNETLSQTSDFFSNNSNIQILQTYCQQNMIYCRYYCTKISPNNSLCSQLQFPQYPTNGSFRPMMNYPGNGGAQ